MEDLPSANRRISVLQWSFPVVSVHTGCEPLSRHSDVIPAKAGIHRGGGILLTKLQQLLPVGKACLTQGRDGTLLL